MTRRLITFEEIGDYLDYLASICEDLEKLGFDVGVDLREGGPVLVVRRGCTSCGNEDLSVLEENR